MFCKTCGTKTRVKVTAGGVPFKRYRYCNTCRQGFTTVEVALKGEIDVLMAFVKEEVAQKLIQGAFVELGRTANIKDLAKRTLRHAQEEGEFNLSDTIKGL